MVITDDADVPWPDKPPRPLNNSEGRSSGMAAGARSMKEAKKQSSLRTHQYGAPLERAAQRGSMPATGYNIIPEADEHEERGAASKSIASGLANSRDRSPSKAKSKLHLSQ